MLPPIDSSMFLLGWFRRVFEQRNGRHDLSALTVATLDDVFFNPGILHGSPDRVLTDAFDRHYRPIADVRDRNNARTRRDSADDAPYTRRRR